MAAAMTEEQMCGPPACGAFTHEVYAGEAVFGGTDPELYALFDELDEVSEDELGQTFDSLIAIAAQQPDDAAALKAVGRLVAVTMERGYVEQAMQMAMTLGAAACLHSHLQETANETGMLFDEPAASKDKHNHDSVQDKTHSHDAKTCKDCKAGKKCTKKH